MATEKMYKIDDHVACAVAGITSDANILINHARLISQRYLYAYQEPIPIESLLQQVCDLKQGYTQFGGLRPFGVSFLFAGYDAHHGFQMYQSDPSGNYGGWKARAIGANNAGGAVDPQDGLQGGRQHGGRAACWPVKVLSKTMDTTTPSAEKLEIATVTREEGEVKYRVYARDELKDLLKRAEGMLKEEASKESGGDI